MSGTEKRLTPPTINWMVEPTFDEDGVQVMSGMDDQGREWPDPVPQAPPVPMGRQVDDLHQMIRSLVHQELFKAAVDGEGFGTFEEEEDFEIEDDPLDPLTPYEEVFNPMPRNGAGDAGGEGVGKPPQGTTSSPSAAPAPPVAREAGSDVKRSERDEPGNGRSPSGNSVASDPGSGSRGREGP